MNIIIMIIFFPDEKVKHLFVLKWFYANEEFKNHMPSLPFIPPPVNSNLSKKNICCVAVNPYFSKPYVYIFGSSSGYRSVVGLFPIQVSR